MGDGRTVASEEFVGCSMTRESGRGRAVFGVNDTVEGFSPEIVWETTVQ
jgi:hypothetical protein